jgi:hypothetical protein
MSVETFQADVKRWLADTEVGTFPQALHDQARKQGWLVISMKDDWKRIFAFDQGD